MAQMKRKFWQTEDTKFEIRELLQNCNATFHKLIEDSWYIYGLAICILTACLYFLIKNYQKNKEMQQHRLEMHRRRQRLPQRRRPGATHREHEIFGNILANIRQLMPLEPKKSLIYVLRQSASGRIHGSLT